MKTARSKPDITLAPARRRPRRWRRSPSARCRRPAPTRKAKPPPKPLYWGAHDRQPADRRSGALGHERGRKPSSAIAGKGVSSLSFSLPFADCSTIRAAPSPLPDPADGNAARTRLDPLPQLGLAIGARASLRRARLHARRRSSTAPTTPTSANSPKQAQEWGHPFFLRFDWEMNGFWFPWSEGVNGNKPGEFVAAWRHVHDIFTAGRRHQRDLGLVPERRLHPQPDPARAALPRRRLRRLDLPRRLQLGQDARTRPAGRTSTRSSSSTYKRVAQDRPEQADGDRRGRLRRARRLEGELDQATCCKIDPPEVPQDPRA